MKKSNLIYTLAFLLFIPFVASSQSKGKRLTAYLQTKQFSAPEIGNYIELHFQYVGYSLAYKQQENDLIGEVAVMIDITQSGQTVANDAYRLNTPLMVDGIVEDFYDIKRFALSPGTYQCDLELLDLNSANPSVKTSFDVVIEELSDALSVSDILIAESAFPTNEVSTFFKSGYDIIPRISTFYPTELSSLPVYFEVYNAQQLDDSLFSIRQQVINGETEEILKEFTRVTKHRTASVVPVFKTIDMVNLPTGKYLLNMTILDGNSNELSSQFYEFERSNDGETVVNTADLILDPHFQGSITDDSVGYYLASLIPISQPGQVRTILRELKTKDKERGRKMIQAIWKQTDPLNPYEAWMRYKEQVQYVERAFRTHFQPGFETDRGRVYLQYGAPNRIWDREISASEYPYEMWEYNKIGIYSNKKFIFYNPDLVNNTYKLLHSDMIGELRNPRWQYELNSRNTKRGNVDDPNEYNPDSWGNNARQILGN